MDLIVYILSLRLVYVMAECNEPPTIDHSSNNASTSGPFKSGDSIKFECNAGSTLVGTNSIYTCSGDRWINGDIRCVHCSHIEIPENARIVNAPTYEVGSSIYFECNEGYVMVGESRTDCRADGKWSQEEMPTCKIKICGEFGSIRYGSTIQKFRNGIINAYGNTVRVTCNQGYVLYGAKDVTCQSNGNWSAKPSCLRSPCPPYPDMNSSCIQYSSLSGNFMSLLCREDVPVTRTGPIAVECINGQWEKTAAVMACYCDCTVNANLELVSLDNAVSGVIGHTSKLDWSCRDGYTKNYTEELVCKDGRIGTPSCVPSNTTEPKTEPPPVTEAFANMWTVSIMVGAAVAFMILCFAILAVAVFHVHRSVKKLRKEGHTA